MKVTLPSSIVSPAAMTDPITWPISGLKYWRLTVRVSAVDQHHQPRHDLPHDISFEDSAVRPSGRCY